MKKSRFIILLILCMLILTGCKKSKEPDKCNHIESEWIIDKETSCESEGSKHKECTICHEILQEEKIEKTAHSLIHHEGKDATCTESGYKPYDTCEDCDYTTFKEIKIKAHIIIHHEGLDATCTDSGYKSYDTCENCSYSTYETIKPLGHDIIHHEEKEPTEISSGYKAYDTCSRCDYTTYEEIIYKKHNFVNYVCTECFESSPENLKYELMEDESGYYVAGLYNPHSQIKKIVIPDEYNGKPVVGVSLYGFSNCSNLNYIELSDNTLYIGGELGNSLFYNEYDNGYYLGSSNNPYMVLVTTKNKDIESIKINKDAKIIYEYALSECASLKNITFEEGIQLTSIVYGAFQGCTGLENIYYEGIIEDWCNILFSSKYSNPMYYAKHFYIKNSNNEYQEVTEIVIPDTITEIGDYQFYGYNNTTSIKIPESVTSIGSLAFSGCSSLESITIPSSVTSIGNSAFYNCTSLKRITIPTSVTSIKSRAFENCTSLESITIPEGVTSIGSLAFSGCTSLESITIPSSITSIGSWAFENCTSLENVYYNGAIEDWCNITFNYSSSNPMYYATHFYMLDSNNKYQEVTEIVIPDIITSISKGQFVGFNNVTKILIPSSIISIGWGAFSDCTSLKNITIPSSVTNIGYSAFSGCTSLEQIKFEIDSKLESIESSAFANCTDLKSIKIPSSVTSIGNGAFYNCNKLTIYCEVASKPRGWDASTLGYRKAYWNINDNNYVVKNRIEYILDTDNKIAQITGYIENTSLLECLSEILHNNEKYNVTSIEDSAFYGCTSLKSIEIPSSVTSIGEDAFNNCTSLENVYYNGTIEDWCNISFYHYCSNPMYYAKHFYMLDNEKNYKEVTEIEIPETITNIPGYKFQSFTALKSIVIPSSVTSIGYEVSDYWIASTGGVFSNCTSLENVYYNGTIEDWCNISFCSLDSNPMSYATHFYMLDNERNYKEITEIVIPDTITEIGDYQFSGFNNITKITIPSSVTSIGYEAFENCTSLEQIMVDDNNANYKSIDGNLYTKDGEVLIQYAIGKKDTSFVIPTNVTSIGDFAFYNCTNLESIVISSSVTSIADHTYIGNCFLYLCSNLKYIIVEDNSEFYKSIDGDLYTKDGKTLIRYAPGKKDTSFTVPSGVTSIDQNAFSGCTSLVSIIIPSGVTSIGFGAFFDCPNLESIIIPSSVTSIGSWAFYGCTSLENVYYNGTIEDWCNITFNYSSSNPMYYATHFYMLDSNNEYKEVTEIEIPDTITSIGACQFCGFNNVTKILIPSSVISIGWGAFSDCTSLKNITIPSSVTNIGYFAFSGCTSLTIYCEAASKPSGWNDYWNYDNCPVIWGYKN